MALHPDTRRILKALRDQGFPPLESVGVPRLRHLMNRLQQAQGEPEAVAHIVETQVPGPAGALPVRVYRPAPRPGPRPLIVFFHGGGWVSGGIELVDPALRRLANATGAVVASVGYRLAPETRFPGPLQDAHAALCALAGRASELGADPHTLVVAGESAGANLAAAVCRMAADGDGPRIALQLLVCPPLAPARDSPYASYRHNADGYLNTRAAMGYFWDQYVPDPVLARDPLAAPLLATDVCGLPPALVLVAGLDPLCDEGEAYAHRLRAAGVPARSVRVDGALHIFFLLPRLAAFESVLPDIVDALADSAPPHAPEGSPA
ncbi:alpha/beta hydrolase [Streptomyces sp. NPDC059070]|uniref:alpha/beta hydrolase n=1 Tax=Streptomyces sp. NPDC059070 TaxID=3346713 RepID=UPI00369B7849